MLEKKRIEITRNKKAFALWINLVKQRKLGNYLWSSYKVVWEYDDIETKGEKTTTSIRALQYVKD